MTDYIAWAFIVLLVVLGNLIRVESTKLLIARQRPLVTAALALLSVMCILAAGYIWGQKGL
jgi:hypothetical protein